MTSHYLIGITGAVSIVMMITAVLLTLRIYHFKKFIELRNISLGFILSIAIPLVFIISTQLKGDQYREIRTVIGVLSLIFSGIGAFIIWKNILRLRGEKPLGYQLLLEPVYFFALGFLSLNLRWEWIDSSWVATYEPSWGIFIVGLPTSWVMFELALISLKNLRDDEDKEISMLVNSIGFFIVFLSVIILMIERIFLPGSTIYFVAILGLGDFLIAISLLIDPYVMIPNIVNGKSLIISDKSSGGSIIEHHFQSDNQKFSALLPGAMSGILAMLAELTGKDELPPELGYVNLKIVIEENNDLIAYLIVEQSIEPLRQVLRDILTFTRGLLNRSNEIDPRQIQMIKQRIKTEFDFIR